MRILGRSTAPSTRIGVRDVERMESFFLALGWPVERRLRDQTVVILTAGGRFGLRQADPASLPRLQLALAVPEPVMVDELYERVEPAGGQLMEPLHETAYGAWGFCFSDPEATIWEIGSPHTDTHVNIAFEVRPPTDGPIVAPHTVRIPRAARQN